MLTTFEDEDKILKACKLGADGYLVKDIKPQALRKAIECVFDDLVVFHQDVYKQMATMMAQKIQAPQTYINDYLLNAVDIAIIKGISEGKTNKEIGESINYSEGTIKNRVSKLLAVTGLSDRTEVAIYALKIKSYSHIFMWPLIVKPFCPSDPNLTSPCKDFMRSSMPFRP